MDSANTHPFIEHAIITNQQCLCNQNLISMIHKKMSINTYKLDFSLIFYKI